MIFDRVPRWFRQAVKFTGSSSLSLAAIAVGWASAASAAETIIFTYGPFQQSVAVKDLRTFAETGRMSSSVRFLVRVSRAEPESVRRVLTQELEVGIVFLSNVFNSLPGEYVLFQAGQIFHPRGRRAVIESLRGALVISAVDNRISLLEFFENYPTQQLFVDGIRLARTASDAARLANQVGDRLDVAVRIVRDMVDDLLCDCQSPTLSEISPKP
ncbi:MAG: alpha/beta hydrolase [Chloroflexaceae bacterium]|nr:alpha/beta hydrolase [Chloroflexaceae bacterium]